MPEGAGFCTADLAEITIGEAAPVLAMLWPMSVGNDGLQSGLVMGRPIVAAGSITHVSNGVPENRKTPKRVCSLVKHLYQIKDLNVFYTMRENSLLHGAGCGFMV